MAQPASAAAAPSLEQLRQWFDAIDRQKIGRLGAVELQGALALGGLNFSLATVAHIIRIHDRGNTGAICFDEFTKLHDFLQNVQHSFEYFDSAGNGLLSMDDIANALAHAGYELDRPALAAVFARFDPLRRGALGLAEFLAMTLFLRSATATFNAFDKDRKGVIALTFPQFLFASAHCV